MTQDFDVPPGTVFKDLSGLTDEEVAQCFTDLRNLPPDEQEALRDAISHLDEVNRWLSQGAGDRTSAEDDELEPGDQP